LGELEVVRKVSSLDLDLALVLVKDRKGKVRVDVEKLRG